MFNYLIDFFFKTRIYSLIIFSVLILVFTPTQILSKNNSNKEVSNLIKIGLEQSYNFNWIQAESTFSKIINKFPNDPRGFLYKANIYQWYYLGNEDKKDYQSFLSLSDSAIEKASKLLEENPNNIEMLYVLGSTYSLRGIVFTKAENYLDAAWTVKKSETYLHSVIDIDSTFYDAYLGLGLYNFAVGQIPGAFKWALSLAGIEGNKAEGINYIMLAAQKGNLSKVSAKYYLSQILSEVLGDYNSAEIYLQSLVKKYPANLIFSYSYASLEIKKRNLDKAKKVLEKISKADSSKFRQVISLSNFLLGDVYFRKNNFENAKQYYLNFLASSIDNDYKGIASYRLGISYELTGDTLLAKNYFKNSDKGNTDLDDDIFAKRKGEIYSERSLDTNEVKIIEAKNMISAGKFHAAYDSLYIILPLVKADDIKAETYLYLSEAAFGFGDYNESLKMAFAAQSIKPNEETWIKPFAVYYIARSYKKLGDETAFENFIDEAESYDDYDYQNKLQNLIYSLKNKEYLNSTKNLN